MTDFPEVITPRTELTGTLVIHLYDTGRGERVPVLVQTWVDTPFGRAYLLSQSHSLRTGHQARIPILTEFHPSFPDGVSPFTATLGVSVTIKSETLEAAHDITVYPRDWE